MRVAIYGSPISASFISLRRRIESSESRWSRSSTPFGFDRYITGSPVLRNMTPWYIDGRNPQPQLDAPPLVPLMPVEKTTNAGNSADSLPRPYVTHAPKLGRPT